MAPLAPETLVKDAQEQGLAFLVIGGHAINAYGYARTTLDLDFLVAEDDFDRWRDHLLAQGYKNVRRGPSFGHFRGDNLYPVDLQVVDRSTFETINSRRQMRSGGFPVPAPLHLIALKAHALKNAQRAALGKDLHDIVSLARSCDIPWSDPEFQRVLERYADAATFRKLRKAFAPS
jgi:hypothetical protein